MNGVLGSSSMLTATLVLLLTTTQVALSWRMGCETARQALFKRASQQRFGGSDRDGFCKFCGSYSAYNVCNFVNAGT